MTKAAKPDQVRFNHRNAFEPVLEAIPTFRPIWDEFVEEWEGDPLLDDNDGKLPLHSISADLVRHVAGKFPNHENDLQALLATTEQWIQQGDDYIQNLAHIGVIEYLTRRDFVGPVCSMETYEQLPRNCRDSWDYFIQFWGERSADFGNRFDEQKWSEQVKVWQEVRSNHEQHFLEDLEEIRRRFGLDDGKLLLAGFSVAGTPADGLTIELTDALRQGSSSEADKSD